MRHPNAFPRSNNPRESRAMMHNSYDRYIHGEDMFPKVRVENADLAPRKTIAIALALAREWEVIDDDQTFFQGMVDFAINLLEPMSGRVRNGQVIAKVGINAVNFAQISIPRNREQGSIAVGTQDRASFISQLEESPLKLVDGRRLFFVGGDLQPGPVPDAVIERISGPSAVFIAEPQEDPHYELNRILGEQRKAA